MSSILFAEPFGNLAEYATVGYMAKRIQMRKNRYLNMQKNNDAKKAENLTPGKLDRFRARQ